MTDTGRRRTLARIGGAACVACAPVLAARAGLPPGELKLRELYEKDGSFSALARELEGTRIDVTGFMAPPLKADAPFFVLTKRPMTVCPFCNDGAEWPRDIVAVHTKREVRTVAFNIELVVSGTLALGTETDAVTGFVSRVRLVGASVAHA